MTEHEINILTTTALTWRQLTPKQKMALVNACNLPGTSLDNPDLAGNHKYRCLGSVDGVPDNMVVQAVNRLFARDPDLQGDTP